MAISSGGGEVENFIYKVAIIFIPGIIARMILDKLLFYKHKDKFYFAVHSFLLGIAAYILLYFFYEILWHCNNKDNSFDIAKIILNVDVTGADFVKNVVLSTVSSLIIVAFLAYIETNKFIIKLFTLLKVTRRFHEPDVWSYLFNSDQMYNNSWVTVRDLKNDLMYQGAVRAFSDTFSAAELLLEDVKVYSNTTGTELYDVPVLYLTFSPKDIVIECLPQIKQ